MTPLDIRPVTADRWADLAELASDHGFASGCWCMWWRLPNREFRECSGDERRAALEALVADGQEPGLLAYRDDTPVGWVAVAPRDGYLRLDHSTKLYPVDDLPVWAVPCFYVHRAHRRRGISEAMLEAAADYAAAHGASHLEAYPVDTTVRRRSSAEIYTGTLAMFQRAGFTEVARRGGRPIVRKPLAS